MFGVLKHKRFWRSENYNERKVLRADKADPSMIILHYTGMESARAALAWLCDPASEVSAHYVIEENGRIHALVSLEKRAWHAGKSYWNGLEDINSASIGIELVNTGHEFGYTAFPPKQITALIALLKDLKQRFSISDSLILGHSDIAPARKIDPGEKFPWATLAQAGLGLWPQPTEMDYQAAEDLILQDDAALALLANYGYNPQEEPDVLITAFHRHFYPEKFRSGNRPETLDIASIARLLSLLRQKHEEIEIAKVL
jgi:N-acetylmuramoyl-L-alanine amidase